MKHPKKFYSKRALIKGASLIFEEWGHAPTPEDMEEQDRIYDKFYELTIGGLKDVEAKGKPILYNGRKFNTVAEYVEYMADNWYKKNN